MCTAITRLTDSIIACKSLTYLDLSVNNLEKLPDAITSLIGLEELYLNDTYLEFLPANFGRLINLRILELRDNNLITLPKSMSRLQQLQRIDIGNNEFTELPEVIGHLINLTELWCDGNRIRRINCNVANLKELIHFDGSNNLLQYLPTDIGNWQKCQEMCISTNELEELPFSIGMVKSLIALKADENQLQELPDSICELENLEELMVSHNDLFKLPTTIGLLRRLRFLTADENLLRILPNELCSCISLTILSVRGNKLTKIPVDIGRLTQLRVINVVNNFLTQLPVTILNLRQLSALWISDNQSQPLMPLQKEFNEELQCYYLTCYLLPQVLNTTNSTNPDGTSKAQNDYYASENCDASPQNEHLNALENLSLAAISAQIQHTPSNKRRICFASEPVQEIAPVDQTSRLMRSPTPYPKELRMMSKFASKNVGQQQQSQQQMLMSSQKYPTPTSLANNFDEIDHYNNSHLSNKNKPNASNHSLNNDHEINTNELPNITEMAVTQEHFDEVPVYQKPPLKSSLVEIKEARIANTNVDSSINTTNLLHASVQYQPQQLQNFNETIVSKPFNVAYEHDYHAAIDANYHDPKKPVPAVVLHSNNDQLVEYESFNGKNKKFQTSGESSCGSSKRVSQSSSNNSIGIDERTPLENQHPKQQQQQLRMQNSSFYADKQSPNVSNTNVYHKPSQQSPSIQMMHLTMPILQHQNDMSSSNSHYEVDLDQYDSANNLDETTQSRSSIKQQFVQHPPPYHIAKAFTKKSKQDLLIYDIYRNNYQQKQVDHDSTFTVPQHQSHSPLNTTSISVVSYLDDNSNSNEANCVDTENNGRLSDTQQMKNDTESLLTSPNIHTSSSNTTSSPWLFGLHKNPTVVRFFYFRNSFLSISNYNLSYFIIDSIEHSESVK